MNKKLPSPQPQHSVVLEVLEDFLAHVESESKLGSAVAKRLRTTLIEEQDFSPEAVERSLFSNPHEP